ncbi:tetraspanin-32 isoform X1 [Oryctolagus cuniculus]|uniref:tetraspanin-32 isoform X1 n=1 Tax=Oryctolagus cuniculus TaxID=9986 RepID=UPI003879FCFD
MARAGPRLCTTEALGRPGWAPLQPRTLPLCGEGEGEGRLLLFSLSNEMVSGKCCLLGWRGAWSLGGSLERWIPDEEGSPQPRAGRRRRGIPVLCPGLLRPGAGGPLEAPPPNPGGGGRAGHLRPGVRPGAEDHVWRLAAGAGGHPGRGHRCLWCLSFPIRPARLGAWRATASPWARSQFLCCGKRSPFSFLERTGANHCHGAGAPREDCLEGIRSFLWTQQKVDLALLSTALALTVHALLLSSFLWFAIRTCRGLHRRGKYALTPRQPPPESVLPLQSRR